MVSHNSKSKKAKVRINKGRTNFFNNEVSIAEIEAIINSAKIVKLRCFEKKK